MKISVNFNNPVGKIKPMNAVNNGPVYSPDKEQKLSNLYAYRAANIPYARTHDASYFSEYGGEHTVDVHMIFPNFDADPYDANSYDFFYTDKYLKAIKAAETEVFYRLGSKIEHGEKRYGTNPPKDFHKWAVICEHIIRHLNEGWANGLHMNIEYWEIWNEPDGAPNWTGTPEEFCELYAITATHLKSCFPQLKIGGPAVSYLGSVDYLYEDFTRMFFKKIVTENIPIDFFSFHLYTSDIRHIRYCVKKARSLLDEYGLLDTESILDEWNFLRTFEGEGWKETIQTEKGLKGAAFIAAAMTACQQENLDMLMYYDARPCSMNGLFKSYTYEILKGYYPIKVWGEILSGTEFESKSTVPDLYAVAAERDGLKTIMLTYYTDEKIAYPKTFQLEINGSEDKELSLCLLDDEHNMERVALIYPNNGILTVTMQPNTVAIIR